MLSVTNVPSRVQEGRSSTPLLVPSSLLGFHLAVNPSTHLILALGCSSLSFTPIKANEAQRGCCHYGGSGTPLGVVRG